jgi:hypothetical protein
MFSNGYEGAEALGEDDFVRVGVHFLTVKTTVGGFGEKLSNFTKSRKTLIYANWRIGNY